MSVVLDPKEYGEECSLSFDSFKDLAEVGGKGLVATKCGHRFCKIDISDWINRKVKNNETPTCPVCNKDIEDDPNKLIVFRIAEVAENGIIDSLPDASKPLVGRAKGPMNREDVNGDLDEKRALELALRISGNISDAKKPSEIKYEQELQAALKASMEDQQTVGIKRKAKNDGESAHSKKPKVERKGDLVCSPADAERVVKFRRQLSWLENTISQLSKKFEYEFEHDKKKMTVEQNNALENIIQDIKKQNSIISDKNINYEFLHDEMELTKKMDDFCECYARIVQNFDLLNKQLSLLNGYSISNTIYEQSRLAKNCMKTIKSNYGTPPPYSNKPAIDDLPPPYMPSAFAAFPPRSISNNLSNIRVLIEAKAERFDSSFNFKKCKNEKGDDLIGVCFNNVLDAARLLSVVVNEQDECLIEEGSGWMVRLGVNECEMLHKGRGRSLFENVLKELS